MFEPAYVLLAMEKASADDINKIKKVHEEFKTKVNQGKQTADDDIAFHLSILEATHNAYIIRIGTTIMHLYQASIANSMSQIPNQAVRDHNNILQAFLKKDEKSLQEAIYNSFDGWLSMMDQNKK